MKAQEETSIYLLTFGKYGFFLNVFLKIIYLFHSKQTPQFSDPRSVTKLIMS